MHFSNTLTIVVENDRMAPELLRGEPVSKQSNVYAFGILLWEVMTHNIPYNDVDLPFKSIIGNIMTGKLRPDCQEGLDRELVECIEKCWAQEPRTSAPP